MGKLVKVSGSYSFWLKDKAYAFCKNQGYAFPDQVHLTILDNKNKVAFEKDFSVKSKLETGYWGISSVDIAFEIPNQPAESEFSLIMTVNATKDGQVLPLSFKVRENAFTTRSNEGIFLDDRANLVYHFNEAGQITKIRY